MLSNMTACCPYSLVEEKAMLNLRPLEAWAEDATWMKRQPGFISTQLHEGIGGSATFLNYAVWESVAHFRRAFEHPDFKRSLERYPATTVASPHLFKRVSVPNLCVGP
jgi:heme-degrading monooxygenase HmoA